MMGPSHALSGAAVWLTGSWALDQFADYHQTPLALAVGTAVCAGGALFPDLDPELVRDMLLRATYDDVQEQEAEIIAYLLSHRLGNAEQRHGAPPADEAEQPGDPGKSALLHRIERTLI